jgi:hypothetical protein
MTENTETTPLEESQNEELTQESVIAETINYNEYSLEELVEKITELIATEKIYTVAKEVENIKSVFYKKLATDKTEKKAAFIEAGGVEEEYDYAHPLEGSFKSAYNNFKNKKASYREEQDKRFASNLKVKKEIIEAIDALTKGEETIKVTFEHFNKLQEKWRNTGGVTPTHNNDLWQNYHHHVELFYDYISINRDLRDLDFKRNLEKKTDLCEKAEALDKEKSLNKAHLNLQELHEAWKEIGPVEREHRETVWERFKEATRVIHKKRNDYFLELKEKSAKAAEAKEAVCQAITVLYTTLPSTHSEWKVASEQVAKLEEDWKALGRLEKSENSKAWKKLRDVLGHFFHAKNDFYKHRKDEHKTELTKKLAICEQAEELQTSTNWKESSNQFIQLQSDWKNTGYVPKHQSEPIWKRFRAACDTFFKHKKEHFKEADATREESLKKKKVFLEECKKFNLTEDTDTNLKALQKLFADWKELGAVPRNKSAIDKEFKTVLDSLYDQLKIDKKELEKVKFQNKLDGLKSDGDSYKLDKERQFIRGKMNDLKKEITQYETNIGFFGQSKGVEKLRQQVEEKIEVNRQTLDSFKEKLRLLDEL